MVENISGIRLSKVAKEFNVGIQTLIDFLSKKGRLVDGGPNSKISESDYEILAKEFAVDRAVKTKMTRLEPVVADKEEKNDEKEEPVDVIEEKTLFIKSTQLEAPENKTQDKKNKHKSLDNKEKQEKQEKIEVVDTKKEDLNVTVKEEPENKIELKVLRKIDLGNLDKPPVRKEKSEHHKDIKKDIQTEEKIKKVEEDILPSNDIVELPVTVNNDNISNPVIEEDKIENHQIHQKETVVAEVKNTVISIEEDKLNKTEMFENDKTDLDKSEVKTEVNNEQTTKDKNENIEPVNTNDDKLIQGGENIVNKEEKEISDNNMSKESGANNNINQEVKPKIEEKPSANGSESLETTVKEEPKNVDDNFLKTNYVKLEGPKVLNKIDLSQFQKPEKKKPQPVASSSDDTSKQNKKKKRKRIKPEKVNVTNTQGGGNNNQGQQTHQQQPNKPKPEVKNDRRPGGGKDGFKKDKFKDNRKELPKVEPTEEEVKKQIQETLARLNPLGKSKTSKHRREKRDLRREILMEEQQKEAAEKSLLKVSEFVTVNELATMMEVPVTQVISTCMNLGMFVSINMRLDAEALVIVADEFGFKLDFIAADIDEEITSLESEDQEADLVTRPPIVTVMGHVDHGKTKLLDYIRNTNVVAGEAGGITQHIGAYEVALSNGKKIAFLDTPGHEAFTAMRARGAEITDVAIIVIAADDHVMPQTKEAINHAQAAGVPIVFALNKIDKPTADVDRIKNELSQMNILVEDWGGKYQCQEISAKGGLNVDLLLDKVLLEAEMLDLKANPTRNASGTVIESSLDKGRGYVAKILVQNGTMKIGDVLVAGCHYGRVKAMYNERNQIFKEAGPSTPLLLLGLNGAPQAGDKFIVMNDEREAKNIATRRQQLQREQGLRTQKHITLDEIGRRIAIGDFKELNIIVKGDVDGSVEALSDSLLKLSTPEVQVNVIHRSVGQVTESDVLLASASNAIIVAFQVRPSVNARKLAEQEQIDIRVYSIIYNAIEEIKSAIEGMLSPDIEEKIVCNVEVRETFKIPKVGTIAGCMVLDGTITRNTRIRVIRDGIVVYNGVLGSLKRFKDDVKEVKTGYECGLNIDNYNDIKVGDIIEGYESVEIKRTLS